MHGSVENRGASAGSRMSSDGEASRKVTKTATVVTPSPGFVRNLHRHIPVPIAERLTNGIALVVVTAARKSEELGIKIGQPIGPFRQKNLAVLRETEVRRRTA
jgi:hypothetical protein